jgi:cytochrome c556
LLTIEGRTRCSNGVTVPTKDPAWAFVQEVRDASMKAYPAAKSSSTAESSSADGASDGLGAACSGCHRKFRDRKTPENRCK